MIFLFFLLKGDIILLAVNQIKRLPNEELLLKSGQFSPDFAFFYA